MTGFHPVTRHKRSGVFGNSEHIQNPVITNLVAASEFVMGIVIAHAPTDCPATLFRENAAFNTSVMP